MTRGDRSERKVLRQVSICFMIKVICEITEALRLKREHLSEAIARGNVDPTGQS